MSIAKELVMNKLYEIPDDLQDETEVLEGLYKLPKLERSKYQQKQKVHYQQVT